MTTYQKFIKALAFALAVILIVGIVSGIVSTAATFSLMLGITKDTVGETATYGPYSTVTSLDIEINAANLEIVNGDEFLLKTDYKYIKVSEKNGTLYIEDTKKSAVSVKKAATVTLYIPEGTEFQTVEIETGAAKADIKDLDCLQLEINLGVGNVEISNLIVKSAASLEAGTGSVTVKNSTLNNCDFDMGVGKFILEAKLTGRCNIDCGVGASDITLIGSKEDYLLDISKGLGSFTLDGENAKSEILGNGANFLEINGGIGEITVNFKDEN